MAVRQGGQEVGALEPASRTTCFTYSSHDIGCSAFVKMKQKYNSKCQKNNILQKPVFSPLQIMTRDARFCELTVWYKNFKKLYKKFMVNKAAICYSFIILKI